MGCGLRRDVIVKTAKFVEGENEHRILPGRTLHQAFDNVVHMLGAGLNALAIAGMLIQIGFVTWLNHSHGGQSPIGQIIVIIG